MLVKTNTKTSLEIKIWLRPIPRLVLIYISNKTNTKTKLDIENNSRPMPRVFITDMFETNNMSNTRKFYLIKMTELKAHFGILPIQVWWWLFKHKLSSVWWRWIFIVSLFSKESQQHSEDEVHVDEEIWQLASQYQGAEQAGGLLRDRHQNINWTLCTEDYKKKLCSLTKRYIFQQLKKEPLSHLAWKSEGIFIKKNIQTRGPCF